METISIFNLYDDNDTYGTIIIKKAITLQEMEELVAEYRAWEIDGEYNNINFAEWLNEKLDVDAYLAHTIDLYF